MNAPLNILFALRQDYKNNPGGDLVQMDAWRRSLQQAGYKVSVSADMKDEAVWQKCDLVFIWHLERIHDSYLWWKRAKAKGVPIVLVPTYYRTGRRFGGEAVLKQAELLFRAMQDRSLLKLALGNIWSCCRKEMLINSLLLIANSAAEKELLVSEGGDPGKIAVIPNVISGTVGETAPLPWQERTEIVCIGHFCPRKNQLALIKALKGYPVCVTFIGGARPMHRRYMQKCIKLSAGQHKFPGRLTHEAALELIRRSKYAVSASLIETPGIANLEAAAAGCGLILPDLAPVKEYFRGCAVNFIDPHSIDGAELVRMLDVPPDPQMLQTVKMKYTEAVLPELWRKLHLEDLLKNKNIKR